MAPLEIIQKQMEVIQDAIDKVKDELEKEQFITERNSECQHSD